MGYTKNVQTFSWKFYKMYIYILRNAYLKSVGSSPNKMLQI